MDAPNSGLPWKGQYVIVDERFRYRWHRCCLCDRRITYKHGPEARGEGIHPLCRRELGTDADGLALLGRVRERALDADRLMWRADVAAAGGRAAGDHAPPG